MRSFLLVHRETDEELPLGSSPFSSAASQAQPDVSCRHSAPAAFSRLPVHSRPRESESAAAFYLLKTWTGFARDPVPSGPAVWIIRPR